MDIVCDFSGWATKANLRCSDGRTIMKDAFIDNDGGEVPLVWQHNYTDPENVLGKALLKNMDEGVYAYCTFNDTPTGQQAKELVKHGDINQLSIAAHSLKQRGGDVLHGRIKEVSLVIAGANPGAYIQHVMCHSDDSNDEVVIFHGEDSELSFEHAEKSQNETTKEDTPTMADNKEQVNQEDTGKEKTVKDVFDTLNEEQKNVVYALIGQALADASDDDDDKDVKHSEGGNNTMYTNVFENQATQEANVLTHADQVAILDLAKQPGFTWKKALKVYAAEHKDTLAHGFDTTGDNAISQLFPEPTDVYPGAPELLERDMEWVAQVLKKTAKSKKPRVRTRQLDARAKALRAKGYNNREEEKALAGNLKLLQRVTTPQTIYYRDNIHRDDVIDVEDFDVVSEMQLVMKHGMEEMIALAILVGDGREDADPDKINEDNIRSVWHDAPLYTIRANVDIPAFEAELQGTNTSANFGENYIFAEAIITSALYAREQYKGKGGLDFYCAPHTLNKMLLARDLNGRRIFSSAADIAKELNVANIYTVEQMDGLTREDDDGNTYALHGIFVNMAHYQIGAAKGGELTSFEDFDMDFNMHKYMIETRLSGALVDPYSAIVLEEKLVGETS